MKVLFDTSALHIAKTGVSNYIIELITAFKKSNLPVDVAQHAYLPLFSRKTPLRVIDSLYRDMLWPTLHLSTKAEQIGADIIHCPAFKFPLNTQKQLLITIHDVYAMVSPADFKSWHLRMGNFYISRALNTNQHVLVLTEFTRQEILRLFPKANPERLHVVHSGVPDSRFASHDPALNQKVLNKYGARPPYLLSVSTIEPRKNFKNLIRAFATLVHKIDHTLVLVGQNGWNNSDVYQLIHQLGVQDRVCFTGFVPDEELNNLYTHADCFVFPSLYEGFGFTPLEAMKCGCPVISSNASCMPEVLGNAAFYFNPAHVEEMASAIMQVLHDEGLRNGLCMAGKDQAEKYSWAKTAAATFEVYRKVAAQQA